MRITRYTDYSLRVLIYLALKKEELVTIREIADAYGISKNHLMKVVQDLTGKGYLFAARGKNGGVRLNKSPEEINVGRLVRDVEHDLDLVECFGGGSCVITPACKLKQILGRALNAFFEVLDQYTLADLLPRAGQRELIQLLGITDVVDAAASRASGSADGTQRTKSMDEKPTETQL